MTAKFATFNGRFERGFEASIWGSQFGTATVVSDLLNQMVFTTSTTAGYAGISSVQSYDLTGSSVYAWLVSAGNQSLVSLEAFPLYLELDASNFARFYITGDTIAATYEVAGSQTIAGTVAYSSTDHKFLRLREQAGTTYWECSSDSVTWNAFFSLANPFSMTSLQLTPSVGTWANEASATQVTIGSCNGTMPDLTSNSQVFSALATEQHATFADYFNWAIVTNGSTVPLWVSTDGSTTTDAEAGAVEVTPGSTVQIANKQVKGSPFAVGSGGDTNSYATIQANTPASGFGTYVSFISDASPGTGKVVISA